MAGLYRISMQTLTAVCEAAVTGMAADIREVRKIPACGKGGQRGARKYVFLCGL